MNSTEQVEIKCQISNSNPATALGLRLSLDNQTIYENSHVKDVVDFEHHFSDDEGTHEFIIELFGKLPEHTKIDGDGNILEDAMLTLNSISIDGIDIFQLLLSLAKYHHDFNGTGEETVAKFFGNMGCNGQVKLSLGTPVYIWLLENM